MREDKFEFARNIGADVVIDYTKDDYISAIMRETEGRGVDVVLDTIGGDTLAAARTCSPISAASSPS